MPRLKMLRGPDPNTNYELDTDMLTIGRGRKNDIIIQDNEVSRTHCRLVRVLDDYEIHDLNSTNGTFVNGQKVEEGGWLLSGRCLVEMGDSITLEYLPSDVFTGTSIPMSPKIASSGEEKIYYLIIEQESQDAPEIYVLDRVTITIGRDTDNDIVLSEPAVSRHHMRLVLNADGYSVEDLNTMNGTMVNRIEISQQRRLQTNDRIGVGTGVSMWYTDDPDALIVNINNNKTTLESQSIDETEETTRHNRPEMLETDLSVNKTIGAEFETGQLEKSLFLTYAREEWTVIGAHIFNYLVDNNVKVFAEQYLAPNTETWEKTLEQATAESPCLLAIISDKSIAVPRVTKLIRHFIAREKSVLLMRYGTIDNLPMIIRNMPAIPFDPQNPEKTFRIVLAELRRIGL